MAGRKVHAGPAGHYQFGEGLARRNPPGGVLEIGVLGDADGFPNEAALYYSVRLEATVVGTPAWTGASGLNWRLEPGDYWITFGDRRDAPPATPDGPAGSVIGVIAPFPSVLPVDSEAIWHPDWVWPAEIPTRDGWSLTDTAGNPNMFQIGVQIIATTDAPAEPVCWDVNGSCYINVSAPEISWSDARAAAAQMTFRGVRGHLATITSQAEQDFIDTRVLPPAEQQPPFGGTRGWLGAFQATDGAPWQWVTGEAFTYTNWREGEPRGDTGNNFVEFSWDLADWNDTANSDPATDGYLVEYSPVTLLRCLDDVNGDGVTDVAAIRPDGRVSVKDLLDRPVADFAFTATTGVIDVEVLADTDGNGAAELAAIGGDRVRAEVRDAQSGAQLAVIGFDWGAGNPPVDLEIAPDQDGNGVPELVNLDTGPVKAQVKDSRTGNFISRPYFSDYFTPLDIEVYPDLDADGIPELAVLGTNDGIFKAERLEVRNLLTGALVRDFYLSRSWTALQHEVVRDINGDGFPEAVILRTRPDNSRNQVVVRSLDPQQSGGPDITGFIHLDSQYPPLKLLTIGDINGNGSDEVVVFGRRTNGGNQKAQVKDTLDIPGGRRINAVFFDPNFVGIDITACRDSNGNGSEELAMLGLRSRDGKLRAIVKDALTSELIGKINFDDF